VTKILPALAFAAIAFYPAAAAAQPAVAEMSSAQILALVQSDRRGLVSRNIALTPEESAKFWPLYDAFRKELERPEQRRSRAMLDFVNTGADVTGKNAQRLVEQVLEAEQDEARMRRDHFKRLLKVLPADKAARYMQIENKMRAVVDYETARVMPLAR
jgi:Spy/CpxP family protein refolding chaperone